MVPTRSRTRSLQIASLTPYPLHHEIADQSTIGVFIYSKRALRTRERCHPDFYFELWWLPIFSGIKVKNNAEKQFTRPGTGSLMVYF